MLYKLDDLINKSQEIDWCSVFKVILAPTSVDLRDVKKGEGDDKGY